MIGHPSPGITDENGDRTLESLPVLGINYAPLLGRVSALSDNGAGCALRR
jgi:hypothetical protein